MLKMGRRCRDEGGFPALRFIDGRGLISTAAADKYLSFTLSSTGYLLKPTAIGSGCHCVAPTALTMELPSLLLQLNERSANILLFE